MIRLMTSADIAGAMRLKEAAGWNQTEADWARLLALEPEGCFVDEREGVVAGTATAVCCGEALAWIGMVLVSPDYRRRGIARALMEHTIQWLRARNVRCIKLDATDAGYPLYAQLGFVDECAIERWERRPGGEMTLVRAESGADDPLPVEHHFRFDRQAFGADRARVLEALATSGEGELYSYEKGYLLGRPGSDAYFLGPCVASDVATASRLLSEFLAKRAREAVFWDLLPAYASVVDLASSFGFQPKRRLTRMVLGDPASASLAEHPEFVYAAAGFEFG